MKQLKKAIIARCKGHFFDWKQRYVHKYYWAGLGAFCICILASGLSFFGAEANTGRVVRGAITFETEKNTFFRKANRVAVAQGKSAASESTQEGQVRVTGNTSKALRTAGKEEEKQAKKRGLISLVNGTVRMNTADGSVAIRRLRDFVQKRVLLGLDPLEVDMFADTAMENDSASILYGEVLDKDGKPLRWASPSGELGQSLLAECAIATSGSQAGLSRLMIKVKKAAPLAGQNLRAGKYKHFVERYSSKYSLPSALVLAIMHTESNFNPSAVSRSRALGLMQIVPETAGEEAHNYLTGTRAVPTKQTLLTPEHNIKYGTTYLHLLSRYYFGDVENRTSRQLCMIAAYNGGPGAVLRVFDSKKETAVAKINSMTSDEVYAKLTSKMPTAESRKYIAVVLGHYHTYMFGQEAVAVR